MKILLGKKKITTLYNIHKQLEKYYHKQEKRLLIALKKTRGTIICKNIKNRYYYYLVEGRKNWTYVGRNCPYKLIKEIKRRRHKKLELKQQLHTVKNNLYAINKLKRDQTSNLNSAIRFQILKRDNFKCQYCGRTIRNGIILEVDHIIPKKSGGSDRPKNLITACNLCNSGKGKKYATNSSN